MVFLGRSLDLGTPANGTVTNNEVSATAAIATSKLSGAVTSITSHGLGALASLATVGTTQIDNDSVTGAKLNPALVAGDIIYADGTDTINRLAKPASPAGEVLTFATSATAPSWVAPAGGGKVQQMVYVMTGANSSQASVQIPQDDTIPQNTEGHEVMTLAITPTSATNLLKIEVMCCGATSNNGNFTIALFQDTTANALSVAEAKASNANPNMYDTGSLTHVMVAGTASATTFKVRMVQMSATGTNYFNSTSAGRKHGGVANSGIIITEITP